MRTVTTERRTCAFPLPIATERTRVRRMEAGDFAVFVAYRSDPELGRYQGWTAMDAVAARAFIERMAAARELVGGEWLQVAIADAATNVLLGDIGIRPDADLGEVEIGFTLASPHQSRGIAAEAVGALVAALFRHTPAQGVRGVTDARNRASIALLERLHFRRVLEQEALFRGEPCREYVYMLERARPA